MSYNFIYDTTLTLAKRNNSNLASLYLFKYCLAELYLLKQKLNTKTNVINHPDWNIFVETPEFVNSGKILENLLGNSQKAFQSYYSSIMQLVANQYGPQVAQGIIGNLGNGPYAPIKQAIPIYELKTNWIGSLGNSPEEYILKLQCMVLMALLEKKELDLDFYALEVTKKSSNPQEYAEQLQKCLKNIV